MKKIILIFSLFLIISCSKEELYVPDTSLSSNCISESVICESPLYYTTTNPLKRKSSNLTYLGVYNDLDWETPKSLNVRYHGATRKIILPTFNNAIIDGYMSDDIRADIKKIDGWELLYNWIPTNDKDDVIFPAFMLYNKYRGTLKLFYYHLGESTTSGNVMCGLYSKDKPTQLFSAHAIYSPNLNQRASFVSQSSYASFDDNLGIMPNTWYAFEWDVSIFDDGIGKNSEFGLYLWGVDIQNISLTGNSTGKIDGSLTKTFTESDFNKFRGTAKTAITNATASGIVSLTGDKVEKFFNEKRNKTNNKLVGKLLGFLGRSSTIGSVSTFIAGPIGGLLATPLTKFVGKFFSFKDKNRVEKTSVKLKIDLKHNLNGKITRTANIFHKIIALPDRKLTDNSYCGQLGVFSLSRTPVIKIRDKYIVHGVVDTRIFPRIYDKSFLGKLDQFDYIHMVLSEPIDEIIKFNPDLLKIANIEYSSSVVSDNSCSLNIGGVYREYVDYDKQLISIQDGQLRCYFDAGYAREFLFPAGYPSRSSKNVDVQIFPYKEHASNYVIVDNKGNVIEDPVSGLVHSYSNNYKMKVVIKVSPKNGDNGYVATYLCPVKVISRQWGSPLPYFCEDDLPISRRP